MCFLSLLLGDFFHQTKTVIPFILYRTFFVNHFENGSELNAMLISEYCTACFTLWTPFSL
jgi:hypothetical protein